MAAHQESDRGIAGGAEGAAALNTNAGIVYATNSSWGSR